VFTSDSFCHHSNGLRSPAVWQDVHSRTTSAPTWLNDVRALLTYRVNAGRFSLGASRLCRSSERSRPSSSYVLDLADIDSAL
jgi:hypothetical protein